MTEREKFMDWYYVEYLADEPRFYQLKAMAWSDTTRKYFEDMTERAWSSWKMSKAIHEPILGNDYD